MTTQQQTTAARHAEADTDEQMHAIVQDRYGSADVLEFTRVPRPTPQADEVLIEVVAAGVDRGTCHLMTGTPYLIRLVGYGLTKPKRNVRGSDVAGRVVAVGADVTRFVPGDQVFGIAKGSLAEFAVANEDNLVIKPADVSFEHAAASAVSGITALQALVDVGGAEPGQRVLIVGASGGVGSFAVQLAKALGTEVTAVASTRNIDFVRSLGADHVVDYTTRDFTEIDEPFDLIVDIGGRNSIRRLRSVLTATGTLVIVGGEGGNRITGGVGRQLRAMVLSAIPEAASDDVHQWRAPLPHRAARCAHRIRSRHAIGPSNVSTCRCTPGHRPTRYEQGDRQDRHHRPKQRRRSCRMNRQRRTNRPPATHDAGPIS